MSIVIDDPRNMEYGWAKPQGDDCPVERKMSVGMPAGASATTMYNAVQYVVNKHSWSSFENCGEHYPCEFRECWYCKQQFHRSRRLYMGEKDKLDLLLKAAAA